jgi:CBS domain-containing protein
MEPREFLAAHPPFDALDAGAMRQVERALEIVFVPRGTTILSRSDRGNDFLFVVRKGSVRLERDGATVQMLEEGEPFGYPSLLSGESPTVDVIADEDSLLFRLPKATFDQLIPVPAFGQFFLDQLAGRLRASVSGPPTLFSGSLSSRVADLVGGPPVVIAPEASIVEAAETMDRERVSSLIVSSDPPAIMTDRDLRSRVVAARLDSGRPVLEVATRSLTTVPAHATLFEALVTMLEHRIHHLPVVDEETIIGVISDTDLLRHQVKTPLYLLRLLERLEDPEHFPEYAREMAAMVDVLFHANLDTLEIGRIVASLNDAAAKRLLAIGEQRFGPAPMPYAWIVFGSEGRMEQALLTDQDNALVYADAGAEADAYFRRLAGFVVDGLAKLGIPRCPGDFMATRWCMPLAMWERQFAEWIASPGTQALIDAANFFDFRSIHGTLLLDSLEEVIRGASRQRLFLGMMAKNAIAFRPPLGLFRRIREKSEGVDLKRGGIIPIVGIARLYALELGIPARATVERITRASDRENGISSDGADVLRETFRFLLHLRLSDQLRARRAGGRVDNAVRLDDLSLHHRRQLKETFVAIADFQQVIAQRYGTSLLS